MSTTRTPAETLKWRSRPTGERVCEYKGKIYIKVEHPVAGGSLLTASHYDLFCAGEGQLCGLIPRRQVDDHVRSHAEDPDAYRRSFLR